MTELEGKAAAESPTPAEPSDQNSSEQEPVVRGTVFLTAVLLILVFGFWAVMYLTLLNR